MRRIDKPNRSEALTHPSVHGDDGSATPEAFGGMYQAGYDPTGLVDMFEKLESLEKRKPGTIARVFATHPMTEDRVRSAQKNIQENLKTKPAFVLNTSEFDDIKDQVLTMHNTRKLDDPNKPQLRKAPGADPATDEDPKPTLKRRLAAAD